MSEEVLGFRKKDALYDNGGALVQGWAIDEDKLVPVRLKSESVSLEEFEKVSKLYSLSLKTIEKLVKAAAKRRFK